MRRLFDFLESGQRGLLQYLQNGSFVESFSLGNLDHLKPISDQTRKNWTNSRPSITSEKRMSLPFVE
jgi:hypothetical protein